MDCPICYYSIQYSAIGSCTHHFCYKCLIQWCKYGETNCPVCKIPIIYIRQDLEFDMLARKVQDVQDISINDIVIKDRVIKDDEILNINFEKDDMAGITLQNNYIKNNSRAPGVLVYKIDKNSKCYECGLRKNDIIISINNIPCMNHKQSISIINRCVMTSIPMICSLLIKTYRYEPIAK